LGHFRMPSASTPATCIPAWPELSCSRLRTRCRPLPVPPGINFSGTTIPVCNGLVPRPTRSLFKCGCQPPATQFSMDCAPEVTAAGGRRRPHTAFASQCRAGSHRFRRGRDELDP
jgi:hypothetical protein